MINAMEVREDDEEFQNQVDLMFEDLEREKPDHFAVRQYKKFKLAAGTQTNYYILLFTFLFKYVYRVPPVSQNNLHFLYRMRLNKKFLIE